MLTPVPAIDEGLGFLGAEVARLTTPVALDMALPGRDPGVVSPDRVSVYITLMYKRLERCKVWEGMGIRRSRILASVRFQYSDFSDFKKQFGY